MHPHRTRGHNAISNTNNTNNTNNNSSNERERTPTRRIDVRECLQHAEELLNNGPLIPSNHQVATSSTTSAAVTAASTPRYSRRSTSSDGVMQLVHGRQRPLDALLISQRVTRPSTDDAAIWCLPPEVLLHILSILGAAGPDDLLNVRLLSLRWCRFVDLHDTALFRPVCLRRGWSVTSPLPLPITASPASASAASASATSAKRQRHSMTMSPQSSMFNSLSLSATPMRAAAPTATVAPVASPAAAMITASRSPVNTPLPLVSSPAASADSVYSPPKCMWRALAAINSRVIREWAGGSVDKHVRFMVPRLRMEDWGHILDSIL